MKGLKIPLNIFLILSDAEIPGKMLINRLLQVENVIYFFKLLDCDWEDFIATSSLGDFQSYKMLKENHSCYKIAKGLPRFDGL